jgi:hypothetical protein
MFLFYSISDPHHPALIYPRLSSLPFHLHCMPCYLSRVGGICLVNCLVDQWFVQLYCPWVNQVVALVEIRWILSFVAYHVGQVCSTCDVVNACFYVCWRGFHSQVGRWLGPQHLVNDVIIIINDDGNDRKFRSNTHWLFVVEWSSSEPKNRLFMEQRSLLWPS